MRKVNLVIIGLLLALGARAYAYDDHDFQVWNTEAEEFKINPNLKCALEEEFRWGDNAHEFYYQHYDAGVFYTLNKHWNIGGGYRHVLSLQKKKWKVENEPYVAATLSWDLAGWKFDDRNRMEYRHFDYQADAWRYRNKLTLRLPWKLTKLEIQPFISDEIYVRFGGTNQFAENRLSSGLSANLSKNIKAEIYYLLDTVKNKGLWLDANILGTKLKIAF